MTNGSRASRFVLRHETASFAEAKSAMTRQLDEAEARGRTQARLTIKELHAYQLAAAELRGEKRERARVRRVVSAALKVFRKAIVGEYPGGSSAVDLFEAIDCATRAPRAKRGGRT